MRYLIIILLVFSLNAIGQTLIPGTISADQTICATCLPARLTSTPPNGTAPTYQWQRGLRTYQIADISGETNATYQPPLETQPYYYRQRQNSTGTTGGPLNTNIIQITVSQLDLIRTLQNIDTYDYLCYNATDTLTVDGTTYPVIVESGGGLVLIAGSNVILKPGVSVISGGYLHGYVRSSIKAVNQVAKSTIKKINGVVTSQMMRVGGVNNY